MARILDNIDSPAQLRTLTVAQMQQLAEEIRREIVECDDFSNRPIVHGIAAGEPRIDAPIVNMPLPDVVKHYHRAARCDEHAEYGHGMRGAMADLQTQEARDQRARERRERDGQIKLLHGLKGRASDF